MPDAQTPGPSAALRTLRAAGARALLAAALAATSLTALAQTAEAPAQAAATESANPATATTDASPLLERSTMFAGDISMLLNNPDGTAAEAPVPATGIPGLLSRAMTLLGTPYRWGGTTPERGFDCSGLVGYVYRTVLGIELPRVSRDMAATGTLIKDRAALAAGDLVFFGRKGRVNHVGIYVGDGKFVHAPSRGKDVTVSSLSGGYWGGRYMQARRVAEDK